MKTRAEQVLTALKDAGSKGLTVKDSMSLNIGTELRKRISELRRDGHEITEQWEKSGKQRYKRYFLVKEFVPPKKPHMVFDTEKNTAWPCTCYLNKNHNA